MLRSHWSSASNQHSEPHEADSHRETYVPQHWTQACPVHLIPSPYIMIHLHIIVVQIQDFSMEIQQQEVLKLQNEKDPSHS